MSGTYEHLQRTRGSKTKGPGRPLGVRGKSAVAQLQDYVKIIQNPVDHPGLVGKTAAGGQSGVRCGGTMHTWPRGPEVADGTPCICGQRQRGVF